MTIARQSLGRRAEALAADALRRTGALIVARNVRVGAIRGEIDLIVVEAETLVFVEVKALSTGARLGPERPALAVGPRKQAKLRALARAWLAECSDRIPRHRALRFDVIGMRIDPHRGVTEWEHVRGAF